LNEKEYILHRLDKPLLRTSEIIMLLRRAEAIGLVKAIERIKHRYCDLL